MCWTQPNLLGLRLQYPLLLLELPLLLLLWWMLQAAQPHCRSRAGPVTGGRAEGSPLKG